jgi:hypothetical protein
LFFVVLFGMASCTFLAQLHVPEGAPVLGGIAPDARLVVTAQVAPVYADPRDNAPVVGSFAIGTAVRATGPDTAEWVCVSSVMSDVSGWVRWADIAELRR